MSTHNRTYKLSTRPIRGEKPTARPYLYKAGCFRSQLIWGRKRVISRACVGECIDAKTILRDRNIPPVNDFWMCGIAPRVRRVLEQGWQLIQVVCCTWSVERGHLSCLLGIWGTPFLGNDLLAMTGWQPAGYVLLLCVAM